MSIDFAGRQVASGVAGLCDLPPHFPPPLCLTLPGGVEICPQPTDGHVGLLNYAALALGMANSTLSPFAGIFRLVDVVIAIQKCLAAVPGVISNPGKLADALKDLVETMRAVLRMLPYLSIPIVILQLLDMLIAMMTGVAQELLSLHTYIKRIEAAELAADKAPAIQPVIACARATVDVQIANLSSILGPINPTIEMLNLFASLAQLGKPFPIARLDALPDSGGPELMANTLLATVEVLRSVRESIPV